MKHTNVESFRYFGYLNRGELEYDMVEIIRQTMVDHNQEKDSTDNNAIAMEFSTREKSKKIL